MNQWINEIFQNSKRVAVPVMTHPGIELTGHRVIEAVTDGRVHYEAIKYLADHYPSFATSTIMDLTVPIMTVPLRCTLPSLKNFLR